MSKRFTAFKSDVGAEVRKRGWLISLGVVPLIVALLLFVGIGALLFFLAVNGWRSVYPRWSDVVLIGLAVASFVNAAIVPAPSRSGGCGGGARPRPSSRPSAGRRSAAT